MTSSRASPIDTVKHVLSHHDTSEYDNDFEKSLMCSTPKHTNSRSRKTASVTETANTTFYTSDNEDTPKEPETEWERWILKKAKELSFTQDQENERRKEERRKRREEKRAKREKLKQQEKIIEEWKKKKLEQHKKQKEIELQKQKETEKKKAVKTEEILEKSVVAVSEWKQKKLEKLRDCKAKKIAEEEKLGRLKDERREKAKEKYEEWLKNHKPSHCDKSTSSRPKTLSDFYSPGNVNSNPEPWNSGTDISYKPVKVLYTPFG